MKTKKDFTAVIILVVIAVFIVLAAGSMEPKDILITSLRGLSVGSMTFLVAAGFSLIFGLLDVMNLSHGMLYMVGAYLGWTVFVRPDTLVDVLPIILALMAGFTLSNLWNHLSAQLKLADNVRKIVGWALIALAIVLAIIVLPRYPIAIWKLDHYPESPGSFSFMAEQGTRIPVLAAEFTKINPVLALVGLVAIAAFFSAGQTLLKRNVGGQSAFTWKKLLPFGILVVLAALFVGFSTPITDFLNAIGTNWLFLVAVVVAAASGMGLGVLIERSLIQPLYSRPVYQMMMTIGLSTVGTQIVQAIWGMPEFVLPKPALFRGTGAACPATSLSALIENNCSTVLLLGGRVRVYDEIFLPIVGIIVLISVWLLLKKTRIGMIIRAGVQDSQMVEALGVNVRRVFTFVFALGVGLAALGGVLSAPSTGISSSMGERLLLNALIALAIGGLTSYPGAALGSLLVGVIQQFMIKYGQIGIPLPFTDAVFKPSPAIVPASTLLLMVIVLLILPNGLLGKKE